MCTKAWTSIAASSVVDTVLRLSAEYTGPQNPADLSVGAFAESHTERLFEEEHVGLEGQWADILQSRDSRTCSFQEYGLDSVSLTPVGLLLIWHGPITHISDHIRKA